MQLLEAWYSSVAARSQHPCHLVIIIEDFEAFDQKVFQDVVSISR